jgi:O-methyltransferase/aklanonic acid methyltransferase
MARTHPESRCPVAEYGEVWVLVGDTVVRVFDEVAGEYDTVLPFFARLAHAIAAKVDLRPGIRLLDLGCGTGAITGEALARGCRVTAVDAAPSMIKRVEAAHLGATAYVMDAHELRFPDRTFDAVIAAFVMHVLDDPAAAVREVHRILASGGWFAFAVPGGPADPTEPPDVTVGLFEEFSAYLRPGGSMGRPLDAHQLLIDGGFSGLTTTPIELRLHVADGQTVWRWLNTHGTKAFVDDLPEERRREFHDELVKRVGPDGVEIRRTAWLHTGRSGSPTSDP